jgi:NADPH2 dehydrogenase
VKYRRLAAMKTPDEFRAYCTELGIDLPVDDEVIPDGPLAQPCELPDGFVIGNRFCIQPMEGWDGTPDGKPTDLVERRWRNFGRSGAKLIWGGEAAAVRHDGRANPNQLLINEENLPALRGLRQKLVEAHGQQCGSCEGLLVGLQLTHSGRFCRPNRKDMLEPLILYRHPVLDRKFGVPDDHPLMTDAEVERIIEDTIGAAQMAREAGFDFVDVKHCHGYLGHEFLTAHDRPGPYGGSFENRTRYLRACVTGIRRRAPGLRVGVRLSAFDVPPFRKGEDGTGEPEPHPMPYRWGFGVDPTTRSCRSWTRRSGSSRCSRSSACTWST